jgi:hypothetical protein
MYRIVIPTKGRSHLILKKTIGFLLRHHIDMNKVDIWIGSKEEEDDYRKVLDGVYKRPYIIHEQKDLMSIVNYIHYYYRNETKVKWLLRMDDDIEDIIDKNGKSLQGFNNFIKEMFRYTEEKRLGLWGINAYDNKFFFKDNITTNLKYIVGAFNGHIIKRKDHEIQVWSSHYEDVIYTCEAFIRDGGVVRHNGYGLITKYFSAGGMNCSKEEIEKRKKDSCEIGLEVCAMYGDMVRLVKKKDHWDIRLNHNYNAEK